MRILSPLSLLAAISVLAVPSAGFQVEALAAHWNFDETSGSVLGDQSGNGFDAVTSGVVTLGHAGAFASTGLAAFFDGSQQGLATVQDQQPLSGLVDNLSVAAWLRADPGGSFTIHRVFGGGGAGWSCGVTASGFRFTTKGIQDFDFPYSYPTSTWFHLAFVFDAAHDVSYYVDGALVGVRQGSSPANPPTGPWLIGAFSPTNEYWNGYLDDLQVYEGTLSASDVAFLFQNPGATLAPGGGTSHCFGDSSGLACPCGNFGAVGEGCANSTGMGATLSAQGTASVTADDIRFQCAQLVPGQVCLFFVGNRSLNGGSGRLFGDGLRCAGQQVRRLGTRVADANGDASWGPGLAGQGQWLAGDTRSFQVWYQNAAGSPCGGGFNTSQALSVTFSQ